MPTISRTLRRILQLITALLCVLPPGQTFAGSFLNHCYDIPGVQPPPINPKKVLHVLIDQTMALSPAMKTALIELVSQWGEHGERVTISRFSANIKGQYTDLVFDEVGNIPPTEEYLFHLRTKDKKAILACLQARKDEFKNALTDALSNTLKITDDKLPQTNLVHSLNDFAEQLVADRSIEDRTVLLVSDGLEHSDLFSFHQHGVVKTIYPQQALNEIRRKHLIPNWHQAKIYFFGLGYISDEKFYARPRVIAPLKKFWEVYFSEGNARLNVNSFGTPMLLTKSIL